MDRPLTGHSQRSCQYLHLHHHHRRRHRQHIDAVDYNGYYNFRYYYKQHCLIVAVVADKLDRIVVDYKQRSDYYYYYKQEPSGLLVLHNYRMNRNTSVDWLPIVVVVVAEWQQPQQLPKDSLNSAKPCAVCYCSFVAAVAAAAANSFVTDKRHCDDYSVVMLVGAAAVHGIFAVAVQRIAVDVYAVDCGFVMNTLRPVVAADGQAIVVVLASQERLATDIAITIRRPAFRKNIRTHCLCAGRTTKCVVQYNDDQMYGIYTEE